jgi:hypothetical protein
VQTQGVFVSPFRVLEGDVSLTSNKLKGVTKLRIVTRHANIFFEDVRSLVRGVIYFVLTLHNIPTECQKCESGSQDVRCLVSHLPKIASDTGLTDKPEVCLRSSP